MRTRVRLNQRARPRRIDFHGERLGLFFHSKKLHTHTYSKAHVSLIRTANRSLRAFKPFCFQRLFRVFKLSFARVVPFRFFLFVTVYRVFRVFLRIYY